MLRGKHHDIAGKAIQIFEHRSQLIAVSVGLQIALEVIGNLYPPTDGKICHHSGQDFDPALTPSLLPPLIASLAASDLDQFAQKCVGHQFPSQPGFGPSTFWTIPVDRASLKRLFRMRVLVGYPPCGTGRRPLAFR